MWEQRTAPQERHAGKEEAVVRLPWTAQIKKKFMMGNFTKNELDIIAEAIAERLAVYHKDFLTTREAATYLNMSVSYLYKLTMDRGIPYSKPLGKVCYFERADLDNWLRKNRVATKEEIQQQAHDYCARKGGQR